MFLTHGRSSGCGATNRPTVVVVVLDSVRSSDFPPAGMPSESQSFADALGAESVKFNHAVTTSQWTIPSHASILTGLYPWETGVYRGSTLKLPDIFPTIASTLGKYGYRSLLLSANGFLGDGGGLDRGFELEGIGSVWEVYARLPRRPHLRAPKEQKHRRNLLSPFLGNATFAGVSMLHRFAAMGSVIDNTVRAIGAQKESPFGTRIAPWIEPTFERWITGLEPADPAFCFINLLDAHEPYPADRRESDSLGDWFQQASIRMDSSSYMAQRWAPTSEQLEALHRRYQRRITLTLDRIRDLVQTLKRCNRWDNTWLILTSDHGQSFGEHGTLFHTTDLWNEIIRVPLWIRPPPSARAEWRPNDWVSVIDIFPTILSATAIKPEWSLSGVPLNEADVARKDRLLYSLSDGINGHVLMRSIADPGLVSTLTQFSVACYSQSERKVVLRQRSERAEVYDLSSDPIERKPTLATQSVGGDCEVRLQEILQKVSHHSAVEGALRQGEDRLALWGY